MTAKIARGIETAMDPAPLQRSLSHTLQYLMRLLGSAGAWEAWLLKIRQEWFRSVGLASKQVRTVAPFSGICKQK